MGELVYPAKQGGVLLASEDLEGCYWYFCPTGKTRGLWYSMQQAEDAVASHEANCKYGHIILSAPPDAELGAAGRVIDIRPSRVKFAERQHV